MKGSEKEYNDSPHYEKKYNEQVEKFNNQACNTQDFEVDKLKIEKFDILNEIQTEANSVRKLTDNLIHSNIHFNHLQNISLTNHRLKIAHKIYNIRNLYRHFCLYYNKEDSDRTIYDIMNLVHIYAKINKDVSQLIKINVCNIIEHDINEKIKDVRQMIIKTIEKRGLENLTCSEIFQLILISTSPQQFWSFFEKMHMELAKKNNYESFGDNVNLIFNFFNKIDKISNLLQNENLRIYLDFVTNLKEQVYAQTTQILNSLAPDDNKKYDFPLYTSETFQHFHQIYNIKSKNYIPSEYIDKVIREISSTTLSIYTYLMRKAQKKDFESLKQTLSEPNPFTSYMFRFYIEAIKFVDQSNYDKFGGLLNTSTIFNLHHEIIKDYFTPSFNSLVNMASDVMELSDYAIHSEINDFGSIFYSFASFELNSIIYALMTKFSLQKGKLVSQFKDAFDPKFYVIYDKVKSERLDLEDMDNLLVKLKEILSIKKKDKLIFSEQQKFVNEIINIYNNKHRRNIDQHH